jgi:hypothetical protein
VIYAFPKLGAPPAHLLDQTALPPSPLLARYSAGTYRWLGGDSPRVYRKQPHPRLGPDDVEYRINALGYRGGQPDAPPPEAAATLLCIGSSGLFGTGLPEPETLPAQTAAQLEARLARPVHFWNLSLGGSSADYVTRVLFSAVAVLAPDLVLLSAFPFNRREMINDQGRILAALGSLHWKQRIIDPEQYRLNRVCNDTCNPFQDAMNFLTNFKVWESVCDDAGVPWVFVSESVGGHIDPMRPFMREPRRAIDSGMFDRTRAYADDPAAGIARDRLHPGVAPFADIAQAVTHAYFTCFPQQMSELHRDAG